MLTRMLLPITVKQSFEIMNKRIFLIIITTVFISCSPLSNLTSPEYLVENLSKENYQELNGTYRNYQNKAFGEIIHHPGRGKDENNISLLNRLYIFAPKESYNKDIEVKINFVSPKKADINLKLNGENINSRKIKGRFKKGYFYLKPKALIIPFFPVLYVHDFERIRIGKINEDLVVDHSIKSWGFALFAGGSDSGRNTAIYKRTK